jgi:hypothetical protein
MALVLVGNLKLGVPTGVDATDEGTDTDYSAELTEFRIHAVRATVIVPATVGVPEHGRGGAADYSVTVGYLSNDIASTLFQALFTAATRNSPVGYEKMLHFTGSMRAGSVSAANPEWSGYFVVTEAVVGAMAQQLSVGAATFPMIGPPTNETS